MAVDTSGASTLSAANLAAQLSTYPLAPLSTTEADIWLNVMPEVVALALAVHFVASNV